MLEKIKKALEGANLDENFIEDVVNRLKSFGYEVTLEDAWALGFAMQKAENHIKNDCNVDKVPDGLHQIAVDWACMEFLLTKKQTGQLVIDTLDLSGAVQSIKEGDIQVNFGSGSDAANFDALLSHLFNAWRGDLACYRRLRW